MRLARTPDYAACASWVQLPVEMHWAQAVHDDIRLRDIAAEVRRSVG